MMLPRCYWQAAGGRSRSRSGARSSFRRGWPAWAVAVAVAVASGHEGMKTGLDGDKWGEQVECEWKWK
jgi:hypothetical protein